MYFKVQIIITLKSYWCNHNIFVQTVYPFKQALQI